MAQKEETEVEPDRFPGLRRQRREPKDTKATRVCKAEYWKRELHRERILEICRESSQVLSTLYEEASHA